MSMVTSDHGFIDTKPEEYVLLDILFEEVGYTKLERIPIQSSFVPIDGEPENVDPLVYAMFGNKSVLLTSEEARQIGQKM